MIISRTPFRISFFGGGTDYPEWYREHGGGVLSTSIAHYCYLNCRHLPQFFDYKNRIVWSKIETVNAVNDIVHPAVREILKKYDLNGLEIHHDGDLPSRSGLGSSSSFSVGLLHAVHSMLGRMRSKTELAQEAIDLERNILKENVGIQDQIAAAFGGLNLIDIQRDGTFSVTPLVIQAAHRESFETHLMLFYTGISRFASEIAGKKIAEIPRKGQILHRLHQMVNEGAHELIEGNFQNFGTLLDEGWNLKKSISTSISNTQIDEIYQIAKTAGAWGGKLLGAGGGGFILFAAPIEKQASIRLALNKLLEVPVKFERQGSQIILYDPPI